MVGSWAQNNTFQIKFIMPGILGSVKISKNCVTITDHLLHMQKPLLYHDWYHVEKFKSEFAELSIVHLGILRKISGFQKDGITVILHGEITNDNINESSQIEFIYNIYVEQEITVVKKLKGSFAIVITDDKKGKTFIITDKTSSRPFYYTIINNVIYFSPEIKSLLPLLDNPKPNIIACAEILINYYNYSSESAINDIYHVESATIIEVSDNRISFNKYWDYHISENLPDKGKDYYIETLDNLLNDSISNAINDKSKRIGLLLSGGIDSRAILGYANNATNNILRTFTYGIEEKAQSDIDVAQQLAHIVKTKHNKIIYTHDDIIPSINKYSYILDGMGTTLTDFSVYPKLRHQFKIDKIIVGDEALGWKGNDIFNQNQMFELLEIYKVDDKSFPLINCNQSKIDELVYNYNRNITELKNKTSLNHLHNQKDYFYFKIRLPKFINLWRYAISTELEVSNPLLDDDIMEFMGALPVKYRMDKSLFRETITRKHPELFEINSAKYVNRPSKLIYRKIITRLIRKDNYISANINNNLINAKTYQQKIIGYNNMCGLSNLKYYIRLIYSFIARVAIRIIAKIKIRKFARRTYWFDYPDYGLSRLIRISHIISLTKKK